MMRTPQGRQRLKMEGSGSLALTAISFWRSKDPMYRIQEDKKNKENVPPPEPEVEMDAMELEIESKQMSFYDKFI